MSANTDCSASVVWERIACGRADRARVAASMTSLFQPPPPTVRTSVVCPGLNTGGPVTDRLQSEAAPPQRNRRALAPPHSLPRNIATTSHSQTTAQPHARRRASHSQTRDETERRGRQGGDTCASSSAEVVVLLPDTTAMAPVAQLGAPSLRCWRGSAGESSGENRL